MNDRGLYFAVFCLGFAAGTVASLLFLSWDGS